MRPRTVRTRSIECGASIPNERRLAGALVRLARFTALLAIGLAAGCAELPPEGKTKLADAEKAYRANDLPRAQSTLDGIIHDYPRYNESALAYYLRALCHERQNKVGEAEQDAQQCIKLSLNRELTAKARAMAGSLMFDAGNTAGAAEQFSKAIDVLPEQPPMDMIRYRYGVCLQRKGDWKAAKKQFAIVSQKYPNSQAAPWARRQEAWPHDCFTVQAGVYRDRGSASSMVSRLNALHLSGWLDTQSRDGSPVYFVYSGRYPSWEQAKASVAAVKHVAPDAAVAP